MSKRIVAIILAAVIVMSGIVMSIVTTLASNFFNGGMTDFDQVPTTVVKNGSPSHQIAEVVVKGEITGNASGGLLGGEGYNHKLILKQLDTIKNDDSIKGVLLTVNTPGGGTYESDELYQKLKEVKTKGKKIYVQMETIAASGGYYISMPADKIYAGPQTLTGSIGVISQSMDYSELLKNLGIKTNTIKSGSHKDIMSPQREMTNEERDILQSINKDSFDQFVNVIKEGRHMSEDKVRKLADGRIYSAQQAKAHHLIDEIGYKNEALKAMKKELKLKNPQIITFDTSQQGLGSLFGIKTTFESLQTNVKQIKNILNNQSDTRPMYLYEG
ncbi:signal peptide peptidase SppA [Staphylococcus hyicus]|uniref:signal peptide peptidase SppA n=1 Tax=Staphylococcus hyicus TaxID=1284 RepID=UPI001F1F34DC|nr:signal peptide peptidase SppA [Staphylococcus hyicus]MCE5154608.1 signal peptide peptidase SppA [Staphylococcus hyicus]MCQ9291036.1 signal peptide peptidase SppA [Staphylococcus hyicus]MCQ9299686.1 signal peptide peptidase SppA [Staphylococcus hyicus]MCQ9306277.1 signal peptide peptidase SppA [Staphylococcus hyicus]MCQ9308690.1 signal peptide peptidase SppA [Staphylococcus hyicus]